ncbi:MAG: lanthionine synthetase LanC family protein, partial [Caulobacteraceae bacterium]
GASNLATVARAIGDQVCAAATWSDQRAFWSGPQWPSGRGGLAHGVSGLGWALGHLARVGGDERHASTAAGAFAFEAANWDEAAGGWVDLRGIAGHRTNTSWCNGSAGIALAQLDLDPHGLQPETRRTLQRAAREILDRDRHDNHCGCHGRLGSYEVLQRAAALGALPPAIALEDVLSGILTDIEDRGPHCGFLDILVPSLISGHGSIAYQLLRAHPESRLPSVLLPSLGAPLS